MKRIYTYLILIMSTYRAPPHYSENSSVFLFYKTWMKSKLFLITPGCSLCLLLQGLFYLSTPSANLICSHAFAKSLGEITSRHKIHLPTSARVSSSMNSSLPSLPPSKMQFLKCLYSTKAGTLFYSLLCPRDLMTRPQNQCGQH